MSLPPGFLEELRTRVSLASVVGRKVTWERGKTNAGKGDYWAPCPFHQEKTASFHVKDREGYYYCFGCQAKGDAITFLREAEGMGFMEAVETLAAQAGMQMPARDPAAAARAEARKGLAEVMEACVAHYRLMLRGGQAAAARDYLKGRGLDGAAAQRFELGFAPDARRGLAEAMAAKGVPEDDLVRAGMLIRPDEGGAPYDRFRGRIMFPIRDAQGRCISFGGRAMSAEARAKYLNGPQTELFDKSRSLYHHGPAREAAGRTGRLIVAEGYMDVIALARAGFAESVAPLGTAVTETQLDLMWRMADEPIVALDGDAAGLRAARRLADLALPRIGPGRSLRFALLPGGRDPDDLLRQEGPAAMEAVLASALPLVEMLWRAATEGRSLDSPERRAGLDAELREMLRRIPDAGLRRHYGDAFAERRAALFHPGRAPGAAPDVDFAADLDRDAPPPRPDDRDAGYDAAYDPGYGYEHDAYAPASAPIPVSAPEPPAAPRPGFQSKSGGGRRGRTFGQGGGGRRGFLDGFAEGPAAETRASPLGAGAAQGEARIRECAILWGALHHPEAAERHEAALHEIALAHRDLAALRTALLNALPEALEAADPAEAMLAAVIAALGRDPRPGLICGGVGLTRALGPGAPAEAADAALAEALDRHAHFLALAGEGRAAVEEISAETAGEIAHRLAYMSRLREEAARQGRDAAPDEGDAERSAWLSDFHASEPWKKAPRRRN
ncbi:MAG: DNA primase [Pseudomonadota bacterium]|nr:DNA primase [Pseudomonadota bacterium]MEE3099505.1 DNA primase [Pseudomonadota bacterium]